MFDINGHQFSNADLDETLDDIIDNKDEFQAKHGLTDEEADSALEQAMLMKGMSPEDRHAHLEELYKTNPRIADAITSDAEENHIGGRENTFSEIESSVQSDALDSMLSDMPAKTPVTSSNESSFDLDKPESQITSTFTDEVNNVGANAQSFSLDEAPQVTVTENSPATFSLDTLS